MSCQLLQPIHVQYAEVFESSLGPMSPEHIQRSFKTAFKSMAKEAPLPAKGSERWWSEVVKRTALGAGADANILDGALPTIVPKLLTRFSSKEGYREYKDAHGAVKACNDMGIMTAVITNADARIRSVMEDLCFPPSLNPIVLSEEEGTEKPSTELFLRTIAKVNTQLASRNGPTPLKPEECLHVGDEFDCDFEGALGAGMKALLLVRHNQDRAHRDLDTKSIDSRHVIQNLEQLVAWVREHNEHIS